MPNSVSFGQPLLQNGLPFSSKLAENLKKIFKRIAQRKTAIIVVDGQQGFGKTTAAVHCLEYLQGGHVDMKNQYSIGAKNFMPMCQRAKDAGEHLSIFDEMDVKKRGAMTTLNRTILQFIEEYRVYEQMTFIVTPFFWRIDNEIWQGGNVRMLLHIVDKRVFLDDPKKYGYSTFAGYDIPKVAEMFELIRSHKDRGLKASVYAKVQPNFTGMIYDLPEKKSLELHNISYAGKQERAKDHIKKSENF